MACFGWSFWPPKLFTPIGQFFYTDISVISVTFRNSVARVISLGANDPVCDQNMVFVSFGVMLYMVGDCVHKGVFPLEMMPHKVCWTQSGPTPTGNLLLDHQTTVFSAFSSTFISSQNQPASTTCTSCTTSHPLVIKYWIHYNRFKCCQIRGAFQDTVLPNTFCWCKNNICVVMFFIFVWLCI